MDSNLTERERYKIYLKDKFKDFLEDENVKKFFDNNEGRKTLLALATKVLTMEESIKKGMAFYKNLDQALTNVKSSYEKAMNIEIIFLDSEDDNNEDEEEKKKKCDQAVEKVLQVEQNSGSAVACFVNENQPVQIPQPVIQQISNSCWSNQNIPAYPPQFCDVLPFTLPNVPMPMYQLPPNPFDFRLYQMMHLFYNQQYQSQIQHHQFQSYYSEDFSAASQQNTSSSYSREPFYHIDNNNQQSQPSTYREYRAQKHFEQLNENNRRQKYENVEKRRYEENLKSKIKKKSRWDNTNINKTVIVQKKVNTIKSILKSDDKPCCSKKVKKSVTFKCSDDEDETNDGNKNNISMNKTNINKQKESSTKPEKKKISLNEYRKQKGLCTTEDGNLIIANVSSQYKISRRENEAKDPDTNNNRKLVLPMIEIKQEPIEQETRIKQEIQNAIITEEDNNATTEEIPHDIFIKECEEYTFENAWQNISELQAAVTTNCDNQLNEKNLAVNRNTSIVAENDVNPVRVDELQNFDFNQTDEDQILPFIPSSTFPTVKLLNRNKNDKRSKLRKM